MTDAKTIISSLILNIANIAVLFLVIRALVYKPVKRFMQTRREGVERELAEAEAQREAARASMAEAQRALADAAENAEAEKRRIVDAAEAAARHIIDDAEGDANAIRDSASAQAAHAADRILDDMRERIADLAIDIAGGIIGKELSSSGNKELIDEYFNRVAGK